MEFTEFPKMARLSREVIVTEKIDGTNAQVCIGEDGSMLVGSRTRWITPQDDNHDKVRVASAEMVKTPLWMIEQILIKHETAVIEVMKELNDELLALKRAVRSVHEAKGRYHSQIAMCDLYDACGLKNAGSKPTKLAGRRCGRKRLILCQVRAGLYRDDARLAGPRSN